MSSGLRADAITSHAVNEQGAPVRVVHVTSQFLPRVGGAEVLTLREAVAQRALGHTSLVLTPRLERAWPATETLQGVPIRRTGGVFLRGRLRLRFGAQWLAELALLRALVQMHDAFDVIHVRQISQFCRPVALAALLLRKPIVLQIASAGPGAESPIPAGAETSLYAGALDPHASYLRIPAGSWGTYDIDTLHRSQWLARWTLRLLQGRTVTMLAASQRIRAHLLRDGFHGDRIVFLPKGIETDQYANVAASVAARLGSAAPNRPMVLCIGRYRYEKGLDILLHSWKAVHDSVPAARLVLVGGGELQPQLEAMAACLGLGTSVEFAGLRRDVSSLLAEADAFVLPSRYEGMPNALLEAMAAGLPCIATRVSGSEDVVVHGLSGLLVLPEQPEALAAALIALLTDRRRALDLGIAARERVVRHYARADLMRRTVELYRRLLQAPTGRTGVDEVRISAASEHALPLRETAAGHRRESRHAR